MRERLVNFHARAAGIRENDFDIFAFQRLDKNVAAKHRRADFGARFGFRGGGFRFCDFSCLAHVSFGCGWRRGLKQKPTTVASRGFLSNFRFQQAPTASLTTATTRMTTCELFFNISVRLAKFTARSILVLEPSFLPFP